MRQSLSMPGLIKTLKSEINQIQDPLETNRPRMSLANCLLSAFAMFSLKHPSLLSFIEEISDREKHVKENLRSLYQIEKIPSDTYMRERLDVISPEQLQGSFKRLLSELQQANVLRDYRYLADSYLVALDGTGLFSSHSIHCEQCNIKEHRSGKVTYYHQMLSAVLLNPKHKEVFPLAPEAILKGDGSTKNDCERNAAKRLLTRLRQMHPKLKITITEDGLSSNAPHIRLLKDLKMHYILGVKPGDHAFLFDWVLASKCEVHEETDLKGTTHRYKFVNNVPLNDANFDLRINFIEYWEIKADGREQHFSWVTDFRLTKKNVEQVMKGGRARWKIENETFNTLKNQGYHFEHNYGHGKKQLCTVLAYLMMLAFLIDQIQQHCCRFFKAALKKCKRKIRLWEKIRNVFELFRVSSWENLYLGLSGYQIQPEFVVDSS